MKNVFVVAAGAAVVVVVIAWYLRSTVTHLFFIYSLLYLTKIQIFYFFLFGIPFG